jgi:hypothetical protein
MKYQLVTSCCGRAISDCPGCPENTILLTKEEYMNNIDSIAKRIGLNWSDEEFTKSQFEKGLAVEMQEHHDDPETKVIESKEEAAKVAWAHLKEDPKYYDKLEQIEESSQLSLVLAKIENSSIEIDDFNKLIQEATPASVIDRVRRKVNPNNRNNRKKHDQSGHISGLPKIAARVQPSRKRSNRTQMQHGGKQGHRRSARTQKRTMKKSFQEAIDFFKNNIGKQIDEGTFNIGGNKKLLIAMATKLMAQPNANREWLTDFINRAKNV